MCPPVGPPKVGRYRFYREKAVEHMQVTPMRCTGKCRAYHASKDSSGCSSTQAEAHAKASRRRRECVHGVGNVSEDKSSVRQRIRTKTDRTVTSSLPSRAVCGPKWSGPEEPGAPSPSAWLERRNVGIERNNEQRKCYPFLLVGSNRQTKSPVGLQKGNTLPKMGSASFSMFDSR